MYKFLFLCFLFISCGGGGGGGGTTVSPSDKVFSFDFSDGELITISGVDSNGDNIEAELVFTSSGTTTSVKRNGVTISSIYTSSEKAVGQASSSGMPSFEDGFRIGDQGSFTMSADSETYIDINYVFYGEGADGVLKIVYIYKNIFTNDIVSSMTAYYKVDLNQNIKSLIMEYSSPDGYYFKLE